MDPHPASIHKDLGGTGRHKQVSSRLRLCTNTPVEWMDHSLLYGRWRYLLQVLHTPLLQKLQDGAGLTAHTNVSHQCQVLHQTYCMTLWMRQEYEAVQCMQYICVPLVFLRGRSCPSECCVADGAWLVSHHGQLVSSVYASERGWMQMSADSIPEIESEEIVTDRNIISLGSFTCDTPALV